MDRKDSQTPDRNSYPEAAPRSASRRGEWVLEAVRHLFMEAMADRRG
jgi:hypothetical protein